MKYATELNSPRIIFKCVKTLATPYSCFSEHEMCSVYELCGKYPRHYSSIYCRLDVACCKNAWIKNDRNKYIHLSLGSLDQNDCPTGEASLISLPRDYGVVFSSRALCNPWSATFPYTTKWLLTNPPPGYCTHRGYLHISQKWLQMFFFWNIPKIFVHVLLGHLCPEANISSPSESCMPCPCGPLANRRKARRNN